MKLLQKFCDNRNLKPITITYKVNGIRLKRKGFDIVSNLNNNTLAVLEPIHQRNGSLKWMVHHTKEGMGLTYHHNITNALKWLNYLKDTDTSHRRTIIN